MKWNHEWYLRQMALDAVGQFLSVTNSLFVIVLIKLYKFSQYGLLVLPGYHWPKSLPVEVILKTFLHDQVYPVLIWLPLAIIVDAFVRRPILK